MWEQAEVDIGWVVVIWAAVAMAVLVVVCGAVQVLEGHNLAL